ncbi:MAG: C1 family peptidase [Pseudomonadota bacterium]
MSALNDVEPTTDGTERILNCLPSREPENDWLVDSALAAGLLADRTIPDAKDLRADWWAIGDQGSTGSCVGWAAGDSVIRWHFVKAGRLSEDQLLSVRYLWMASKETDVFTSRPTTFIEADGTSLKAALDIARNLGVVLDSVLPFGTGELYRGDSRAFYAIAAQNRIASYFNLGRNLYEWRRWIAENGPILTRLNVDSSWMRASDSGGRLRSYDSGTARGGHAVALVGYTGDEFIVRNSWGTIWGDEGFAYASDDYASAAFTESYGVAL